MNAKEFVKQRIQNEWNGTVFLGFYEDEEIDMFEMMELYAQSKAENLPISIVRLSLPDSKEVYEAAESFGDLYSLDGQFANGCESGWKAGAEWMRDKVNEHLGNEA